MLQGIARTLQKKVNPHTNSQLRLRKRPSSNLVRENNSNLMAGISCEPGRKAAYNKDLWWRMVWQREVLGYKYHQIASNLNVHPSTVCRVAKLFDHSGSVDHKPYLRDKRFQLITPWLS